MGVCDVHVRELPAAGAEAGLPLDGPPAPGAAGGHGPVHCTVADHVRLIG
ncbi:hypothetical protein [Streptomyces platensis]|nr:hypothetical protein [Streptomyces platensis]MCF3142978.1 hypothetical protein [Streptomyces platensis]